VQDKSKTGLAGPGRLNPGFVLLILAYTFIPVFVPNFGTFDSNGPKFLALALLNLVAFAILLADTGYRKRPELQTGFIRNWLGGTYFLFLIISLLSFISAINPVESLLHFTKIFTVFASAYVMFVIFSSNRKYLEYLVIALTFLLVVDCLMVFYNMLLYISREVNSIMDIKSIYSHKNILTSAIFVKIPFALYLMFFSSGWRRVVAYLAGLCSVLAILILSTRAFYLGMVLLVVMLILYAAVRQTALRKKGYFRLILVWTGLFILAVVMYSAAQRYLFPQNTDTIWNTGVISRLESITSGESSSKARLESWKRTIRLIGDHPLLGVGTGNWKIAVLKYENQKSPDFLYMYKNHNDFLEITAETGLPGGVAFVALIILSMFALFRAARNPGADDDTIRPLFLSAFGTLAYSVDAFFNFPADRPEIQALLAVYLALAISSPASGFKRSLPDLSSRTGKRTMFSLVGKVAAVCVFLALSAGAWVLYLNVKSLQYQLKAYSEIKPDNYVSKASDYLDGFPLIPSVTSYGEPVSVVKSMFLMNEKRDRELIDLLRSDSCNPYDSRREYYISKAYYRLGMVDSAIFWGRKAVELKPCHGDAVRSLSLWLFQSRKRDEAISLLTGYLKKVRTDPEAWLIAVDVLFIDGQSHRAKSLLDSARSSLPNNPEIEDYVKSLPVVHER
jgi:O-antigen ligase